MKKSLVAVIGAACMVLGTIEAAQALSQTFFGEDLNPATPPIAAEFVRILGHPNADAAQAAFLSFLVNPEVEDFEGFSVGAMGPLDVTFGSGTAMLEGSGSIRNIPSGTDGDGRYPTSGDQYWDSGDSFSITFDKPQAAFGFFGVDIGDTTPSGQLFLEMLLSDGSTKQVDVGNTLGAPGGSVLYVGLIDTDNPFTRITFGTTAPAFDIFGYDDFTIAVNAVPEPSTLLLLGSALLVGAPLVWRRRRTEP